MEKEYKSIFEKLKNQGAHRQYEWFQPCGNPDLKKGLMVVGRAVNNWIHFTTDETFENLYCSVPVPLGENGDIASYFSEYGYNINSSAFWRTVRSVTKGLFACRNNDFGRHIVYSNLYKIALPNQNPDPGLQRIQRQECIHILRKEIDFWEPAAILFLTDWSWAEPFLLAPEMNFISAETSCDQLKACGKLSANCRVAVIPHPQGKKECALAGQAVAFFQDFDDLYREVSTISGGLANKWTFHNSTEEYSFLLPPHWNGSPLPLLMQTDMNLQCFRIGIWSKEKKYAPLCRYLSQKMNREFKCNSVWSGGYTEIKFCTAKDPVFGLANSVKLLFQSFYEQGKENIF